MQKTKPTDEVVLMALACGATADTAARQAGVSRRTVTRRLSDPNFQARLQALRDEMVQRSSGMLTASAGEAVKTLVALQSTTTPASVRLGAARAIIELGIKVRETVELIQRIAELERAVGTSRAEGDPPTIALLS